MRECTPEARARVDLHVARASERAQRSDIDIIHMHAWFERVYSGSFNSPVPIVMTLHVPGHKSGFKEHHAKTPKSSRSNGPIALQSATTSEGSTRT